jgi:hypothetical protein
MNNIQSGTWSTSNISFSYLQNNSTAAQLTTVTNIQRDACLFLLIYLFLSVPAKSTRGTPTTLAPPAVNDVFGPKFISAPKPTLRQCPETCPHTFPTQFLLFSTSAPSNQANSSLFNHSIPCDPNYHPLRDTNFLTTPGGATVHNGRSHDSNCLPKH